MLTCSIKWKSSLDKISLTSNLLASNRHPGSLKTTCFERASYLKRKSCPTFKFTFKQFCDVAKYLFYLNSPLTWIWRNADYYFFLNFSNSMSRSVARSGFGEGMFFWEKVDFGANGAVLSWKMYAAGDNLAIFCTMSHRLCNIYIYRDL